MNKVATVAIVGSALSLSACVTSDTQVSKVQSPEATALSNSRAAGIVNKTDYQPITAKWRTDYAPLYADETSKWKVSAINVNVPSSLSVSEANSYAPNADIVWRGEPRGDRRQQVGAIIKDAFENGTKTLTSGHPVVMDVQLNEFHALTEKIRYSSYHAGVHNISFNVSVRDAKTGAVLLPPQTIQSDLTGYTGFQAIQMEQQGQTQKVRITNHVAATVAGWLGQGPDVRQVIRRRGR